ncbi:hypothetical protein [Aeromicrobium wangtongii]|uniref:Uncharacterized protein n=1 Tax=Aeromicrobium wangtongii TaxID=2969247 RepID=A0ABY5M6J0_9ACTN|nr:hypothetical protein [Aeromicrobium wangtongii]MCD9198554.1 hypothetical protein [Aeromicrobium wangtongii]UUP12580.1 hypothetical protein NQV15_12020 [Aeromicrobium wangtongii]
MAGSFLAIVAAALVEDGQSIVSHHPAGDGHGNPAEWRMSAPLDRGRVEAQFELGSLAWWYVGPAGGWVLVDDITDATLHGTGEAAPYDGARPATSPRRRIGYLAHRPDLQRQWATPAVDEELAVLDGRPLAVRGPNQTYGVLVDGSPQIVLDRLREVVSALARSADLPPWFVAACVPPSEVVRRGEDARWTVETWLQAMAPGERTWWLAETSVGDGHLRLTVLRSDIGARTSSLTWLLRAAGAGDLTQAPAPATEPLVLTVLPASQHRDPDDALALAAHDLLGLPDPVVLDPKDYGGGIHWEHQLEVPVDGAALERGLAAGSTLKHGVGPARTWLTNGWSSVVGPLPGHGPGGATKQPWWRRW